MQKLNDKNCCFIFGFGYTAQYLTKKLLNLNFKVIGTTRDKSKYPEYINSGYQLISYDDAEVAHYLKEATHILISVPPKLGIGDPVFSNFNKLIQANSHQLKWLGYLSSTSVYGDYQGEWVDESSACLAHDIQGKLRLDAEKTWMSFAMQYQLPLHVFRLAGIYGPQRNALTRILAGKKASIYKDEQFFSRIHVFDIVTVLLASMQCPKPYSIYNVADDEPAAAHIVDRYACDLLKKPHLPLINYEKAILSPMEKHFYLNNRRVDNSKIKQELKIKLKYPTYREGLANLLSTTKD
ncbi:SDR family oxidoreductase [Legionella sp. D16C41]|uniref:SDR family oxidoreductase n=1 Tax=Legionella sp. D16C41 TaxID=3402688 RepID=UPI003AF43225